MSRWYRAASKWKPSRSTSRNFLSTYGKPPKKHSKKCQMTSRTLQMKSQSNPIPRTISRNLPNHLMCLKNLQKHLKNRKKFRSLRLKQIVIRAVRRLRVQLQLRLLKSQLIQSRKIVRTTRQTTKKKQQKIQNKIKTTANRPPKTLIQNRINRKRQKKNWIERSWRGRAMRSKRLKICWRNLI